MGGRDTQRWVAAGCADDDLMEQVLQGVQFAARQVISRPNSLWLLRCRPLLRQPQGAVQFPPVLPLASSVVCHCILAVSSAPPQASGTMWSIT